MTRPLQQPTAAVIGCQPHRLKFIPSMCPRRMQAPQMRVWSTPPAGPAPGCGPGGHRRRPTALRSASGRQTAAAAPRQTCRQCRPPRANSPGRAPLEFQRCPARPVAQLRNLAVEAPRFGYPPRQSFRNPRPPMLGTRICRGWTFRRWRILLSKA